MKIKYPSLLIVFVLSSFINVFAQSQDQNYIKTTELLEPVDINTLNTNFNSIKKIESVTYFDGFGKAKQSVGIKQSSSKKDVVQHIEYDQFGRASKQYLALPTSQNTGNYISNAQSQITSYYQNEFADQHPFSEIRYDNSPLNRRLETASPGNTWQLLSNSDADHTTKYDYGVNGTDEVYRVEIDDNNSSTPLLVSYYNAEELLKNIIKNENWTSADGLLNTKEVFTDKNGRKIAEFTYENNSGSINKLSTYYVYDDIGNLRYVLPPKLTEALTNNVNYNDYSVSWPVNDFLEQGDAGIANVNFSILNNVLTLKTKTKQLALPSKILKTQTIKLLNTFPTLPNMSLGNVQGTTGLTDPNGNTVLVDLGEAKIENGNLVIDRFFSTTFQNLYFLIIVDLNAVATGINQQILDDLAFQYKYDQFNRQIEQKVPGKDWEYMVYDQLDRPILTQDANLRNQNKWLFNKYDVFGRVVYSGKYTNSASRAALQTQVDNFINASSNKANIVSRTTSTNNIGGALINYTNNAFPNSNQETLTVSYYDDYNFTDSNLPTIPSHILGQEVTDRTKGLLTATWTKTLGSNTWSKNYTFYDTKGRIIYAHDKNHLGGFTENKSKLDFRGKIEHSVTNHKRINTSSDLTIVDRFEYDHVERPKKHYQQINSQEEELIAQNTYNELGQLEKKNLGGDLGVQFEERYIDDENVTINGNTITKTLNSWSWNAGLATKGQITNDGYLEYEIAQNNKLLMVGLSTSNPNSHYNTIGFAIYNHSNGNVYVRENGVHKGTFGTYNEGDVFRVERTGTTIEYKKNGNTFYTSAVSSTGNLIGDMSILSYQGSIKNLKISSGYTDIVGLKISNITDNTLQIKKETGSSGWNAGLATIDAIKQDGNGYLSYKINQTNKYIMVGLSDINTNANYNTIDFAIYTISNGTIQVRESGVSKGNFGTYQAHDEFTIERVGSTINYKKNGDTFYTSTVSSTSRLIGDMSFHTVGGAIYDLEIQNTESGLQTIDYAYNIRGWLTDINDVNNLGTDLFAYKLKYDEATEGSASVSNIYNGNIKQVIWRSAQNNIKKSYAFEYDKLNRFSKSVYRENNSLTGGAGKFETYNVSYDANGNIGGLRRKNQTGALMDNLVYHYDDGNKLISVVDTSNSFGFNNGSTGSSLGDYTYDNNGNLIKDLNKNISNIEYNHLDLVERVTFSNGNKIEFDYDANGSKLTMRNIPASGSTTTVDYLGGFQYTNNILQHFPTPEGYVANDGGTYKYVYILRDHLGNNRVSFSDTNPNGIINPANEILSSTDHYVMGLTHYGEYIAGIGSNYNYKYQGKEQLAFAGYNMYDFGSRMYDASVGRWFNVDPQNQFTSPYTAMGNVWVIGVDPNGEWFVLDDVIAGLITGVGNVIGQAIAGNIDSWGDGFAYFGIGFGAGLTATYTGGLGTAAILSAGNSAYGQYDNTGRIDVGQLFGDTVMGTVTAGVAMPLGNMISSQFSGVFSGIKSQLTKDLLIQSFSGATSGFAIGTGFSLLNGQSLDDALDAGLQSGATGFANGVMNGARMNTSAYKNRVQQEQIKAEQRAKAEQQANQQAQQQQTQQNSQQMNVELGQQNSIRIPAANESLPASPYPPNNGSVVGTNKIISLKKGMLIDRFGSDFGSYFSPLGTPIEARSLPPSNDFSRYSTFKVIKPFQVNQSIISPYYGQPGLGIQYQSIFNANFYLRNGYIQRVYLLNGSN